MKVAFGMHVFNSPEVMMEAIPKLAAMGYDGLEFWDQNLSNIDIDQLKKVLEENDIAAAQLCPYFDFTSGEKRWKWSVETAKAYVELCLQLECSLIRTLTSCPWGQRMPVPPEGEVLRRSTNATEAQWDAAVRGLKEICRMGKRQDIIFSMETTVGFADSSESLLRLFDQVQAENLGANLQVPLMGDREKGMSEMDSVEKLGKHVVHVHANNSADKEKQWPHCFLDEGYIDYDAILKRLHDFGFKGYVSVEHGNWGGKNPLEIAQHEVTYLKRLIESLTS